MTPQCKGDIWDVMLMSVYFFVYVYVSQKIVCILYVAINA